MSEKKIYNKNAREKALLEEAYSNVHNEDVLNEVLGKLGFGALKHKLKDRAKKKARDRALKDVRIPKPDPADVKHQPLKRSPGSRKDLGLSDASSSSNVRKPGVGDRLGQFLQTHPKTATLGGGAVATGVGAPIIGGLATGPTGIGDAAAAAGQVAGGTGAVTDAINDALPGSWGFNVGKWAIPAAVVGGGYLLAKSLSKDKDKDKEESEEGGGLRAAEQEMIQRAQAGEDPHAALDEVAGNHGVDKETLKKAIFGESKIYNKNAREKSLLEEAYASVYREKRLTAAERRALPDSDFALPGEGEGPKGKQAGAYPINDEEHARLALSMVAQHGTAKEKREVRAAVYKKYPHLNPKNKKEDEENPDAHTYSNLGREPGPAAELNPNIGFDEDEEQLVEGLGFLPHLARGIGSLGRWLFKPSAKSVTKAAKKGKNITSVPGRPLRNVGQGALNTAMLRNPAGKGYMGWELYDFGKEMLAPGPQESMPGAPSRADVLTGKGRGAPETKEQLHQRGQPTMSPAPDPSTRPPHWPSDEENIDIDLSKVEVVDVEGLNPNENEQDDARITKAYIHTEDGIRELTDAEYEYINDHELEFVHNAAESELIDYKAGMEDWPF